VRWGGREREVGREGTGWGEREGEMEMQGEGWGAGAGSGYGGEHGMGRVYRV